MYTICYICVYIHICVYNIYKLRNVNIGNGINTVVWTLIFITSFEHHNNTVT